MKKFLTVLLALILCFGTTACNSSDENDVEIDNWNESLSLSAYVGQQNDELELHDIIDVDGKYYLYYFCLGVVTRTPIYTSKALIYNKDYSTAFIFEKITEEKIERSVSVVSEKTLSVSNSLGITTGFETEFKMGAEAYGVSSEVSFSASFSSELKKTNTWGSTITNSESTSNSYADKYQEGLSVSISFSEENGFVKGNYYRLSFYETVKTYGVLIYDVEAEKYTNVAYQNFLEEGGGLCILEESKNGSFEYGESPVLEFNVDAACRIADNNRQEDIQKNSCLINNEPLFDVPKTNVLTISDDGKYGLANTANDELDLSKYSTYFSEDYVFCFNVRVNVSEDKAGKQEIYLYNKIKNTSSMVEYSTAQSIYGLVCGTIIDNDGVDKDHYITWYVRGDEIKETMYIRYDAYGDYRDTWYRKGLMVNLTVVENATEAKEIEQEFVYGDDYTINDNGVFGLHPNRSYEEIDLTQYLNFMSEDYVFMFELSLDLKEKNKGYQEIFLYNKSLSSSSDSVSYKAAMEDYGLLACNSLSLGADELITETRNCKFTFVAAGVDVCQKMYIKYDAYGDYDDTWVKENLKVTIKIIKKTTSMKAFKQDENAIKVYK